MKEIPRQPYKLAHFSIGEGSRFLHQRLLLMSERVATSSLQDTQTALKMHQTQLENADAFINYAIRVTFPKRRNTADLLNETALLTPNTERALRIIDANGTIDNRLKFEVVRKLLLAGISTDLDERSTNFQLRNELHDVHDLLDQEIFGGKTGQTFPTTTYAIHKNKTNEVMWVGDTYPLWTGPGRHVKKFQQQMRYVEDVGYVLSSVREKSREASIAKALRRTVQKKDETGVDNIDTLGAVKDAMGLQFMVKGTLDSFGPRVNVLREKVLSALRKKYGDVTVIRDNKRSGLPEESIQSSKLNSQRVLVQIPGFPIPLELMFYGEGDYINNKYHVGKKDRKTKSYPDGAAHSMYETRRIVQILPVIYPEQIDGQPVLGYVGLEKEAQKTLRETAKRLKKSNKIPAWKAPGEQINSARIRVKRRFSKDKHLSEVY